MFLAQLAIKPQELDTLLIEGDLQKIKERSKLAEYNALLLFLLKALQHHYKFAHFARVLPVIFGINLETTLSSQYDQVRFADVTSTEWAWPSIWSPPARKKAFAAHPVCARREYWII